MNFTSSPIALSAHLKQRIFLEKAQNPSAINLRPKCKTKCALGLGIKDRAHLCVSCVFSPLFFGHMATFCLSSQCAHFSENFYVQNKNFCNQQEWLSVRAQSCANKTLIGQLQMPKPMCRAKVAKPWKCQAWPNGSNRERPSAKCQNCSVQNLEPKDWWELAFGSLKIGTFEGLIVSK